MKPKALQRVQGTVFCPAQCSQTLVGEASVGGSDGASSCELVEPAAEAVGSWRLVQVGGGRGRRANSG